MQATGSMASSTDSGTGWSQRPTGISTPRRCAVIGHPIAHSLSPLLHSTAYRELGIADQFRYAAIDVTPSELDDFIATLGPEWVGLSVTAPHKEAILKFGQPTESAAELRAANTLIFGRDGATNQLFNTDVTGFVNALVSVDVTAINSAIIVGAGATARSCLAALRQLGVAEVVVLARDEQRALTSLQPICDRAGVKLRWQSIADVAVLPNVDVLVSTVPTNLVPATATQLAAAADTVFEAVYNFYPSNLDLAAQAIGKTHLDGMHLLVFQAIEQLRLMTDNDPLAVPLLAVGHRELRLRQGAES